MYTVFVYTDSVKNITFSADEDLIARAREVAESERKTLNDAFATGLRRTRGAKATSSNIWR